MPELPEVETVCRQLDHLLRGQEIRSSHVIDPKLLGKVPLKFSNTLIRGVFRLAKNVVLHLETQKASGNFSSYILVHLRMTGRLIFREYPKQKDVPPHTRASFKLSQGQLDFIDVRRFGSLDMRESLDNVTSGIDPLSSEFTQNRLTELLNTSHQPLKSWLLRQDRLLGIGNIYASEILFRAELNPQRLTSSLEAKEVRRLHKATIDILTKAIKHCGTTFSDFQDSRGEIGSYQRFLKVYKRAGQSCKRCDSSIVRIVQAQRSTFFCPHCQPLIAAGPQKIGEPSRQSS